jgi:hypothetical protein
MSFSERGRSIVRGLQIRALLSRDLGLRKASALGYHESRLRFLGLRKASTLGYHESRLRFLGLRKASTLGYLESRLRR